MLFVKVFIFAMIIGTSSAIGLMLAKKYTNRELELKEIKNALNMFENKIKFTYEDIPTVFKDISKKINGNVGNIFKNASGENAKYASRRSMEICFRKYIYKLKKSRHRYN